MNGIKISFIYKEILNLAYLNTFWFLFIHFSHKREKNKPIEDPNWRPILLISFIFRHQIKNREGFSDFVYFFRENLAIAFHFDCLANEWKSKYTKQEKPATETYDFFNKSLNGVIRKINIFHEIHITIQRGYFRENTTPHRSPYR